MRGYENLKKLCIRPPSDFISFAARGNSHTHMHTRMRHAQRAKARIPCICSTRKASRLVPCDRLVLGVQFVRGGGPQDALDQYRMMKEMKEHPQKGARLVLNAIFGAVHAPALLTLGDTACSGSWAAVGWAIRALFFVGLARYATLLSPRRATSRCGFEQT
jgi:hypothetical protein